MTPIKAEVSPSTTRVPQVCLKDGPSLEVNTSFTCCGTNVGKMQISGFGLRQAEVGWHVSCQADYLIRVDMGGNGSRDKADSPFHAMPKISRVLNTSAVVIVSINKGINEAHHYYPILKAS